ncbi:hypothetical protein SASPL_157233 [Salvia splendens]|uniref:C3H1-type domain-containing protein n=1 Tax=Salvia splendens TaxID=180675 RepID=A0A8X8VVD9_SALSN|nr:hypothetical protein SASPL_157233 [Salvia splendens]
MGEAMQIKGDAIISDVRFKDANSKDFLPNHADTPQVILDAKHFRSLAFTDNMGTVPPHNVYSIEVSPEMISGRETCVSIDNSSSKVISDSETCVPVANSSKLDSLMVESRAVCLAMDGDFVGEKDRCKGVNCLQEGPSGVQNSDLEMGSDEQHPTRPSELGAEPSGNTSSAPTTISPRGEDLNAANRDEILVDGYRLLGIDDLALITSGISCSYRNGPSASDSGDESLASSFDMRSCMSSPEGLQVYSDSCISRNTETSACLSDTEMICRKVAVNKSQTNPVAPQSLLQNTSQVVKKLYPVHASFKFYKVKPPVPQSNATKAAGPIQSSYIRKGNSLLRKDSQSNDASRGFPGSSCSVYQPSPCTNTIKNDLESEYKTGDADSLTLKRTVKVKTSEMTKAMTQNRNRNSLSCSTCNLEEPLSVSNPHSNDFPSKTLDVMEERIKYSPGPECGTDSVVVSDSPRVDSTQSRLSDGYYKSRENQLLRASQENHVKRGNEDATASGLVPHSIIPKIPTRRQSGLSKTSRSSKFSFVWKLHDTQSSEKHKNSLRPRKVWPHLFSTKKAAYWKSFIQGINPSHSNISWLDLTNDAFGACLSVSLSELCSQKLLVSRKRGAIYTKSSHLYSLSLKWSKSIERSSRKANEEAIRAVAAAEKRKKEEKGAVHIASKSRNHVSRKWVLNVKLRPDPKIRVRVLASEKVRWSLLTARLRLARKSKYCQFFTRFGKCNKDDVKCLCIHDPSKVVVCTKFQAGSCTNVDCISTHKVIPERMQGCSYFLKGLCSNDNCPYRHVHVNPDSSVCENFLRGYCADGNECQKKHTYTCPAFGATGVSPQASTCKLHHPKTKTEKKPRILELMTGAQHQPQHHR